MVEIGKAYTEPSRQVEPVVSAAADVRIRKDVVFVIDRTRRARTYHPGAAGAIAVALADADEGQTVRGGFRGWTSPDVVDEGIFEAPRAPAPAVRPKIRRHRSPFDPAVVRSRLAAGETQRAVAADVGCNIKTLQRRLAEAV